MANPVKVDCAKGEWTKVIDNKKEGNVYLQVPDTDTVSAMTPVYVLWQDHDSTVNPTIEMAILLDDNHIGLIDRGVNSSLFLFPVRDDISVIVDATA